MGVSWLVVVVASSFGVEMSVIVSGALLW
jgi:hypothetical protein